MANSKLLKEAIADAKAVKETALANAKLALEEAFTPRLQSILSQKLRAEAEAQDDDAEKMDEELDSSDIGAGMGKADSGVDSNKVKDLKADTDLSVGVKKDSGKPEQAGTDYKKVADISEEENPFAQDDAMANDKDAEIAELRARLAELEAGDDDQFGGDDMNSGDDMGSDDMGSDDMSGDDQNGDDQSDDDMDLEAIIRELEAQLGGDDSQEQAPEEDENSMYEDLADNYSKIYFDNEDVDRRNDFLKNFDAIVIAVKKSGLNSIQFFERLKKLLTEFKIAMPYYDFENSYIGPGLNLWISQDLFPMKLRGGFRSTLYGFHLENNIDQA